MPAANVVSILVGPTCVTCQDGDCSTLVSLDGGLPVECPECGTQIRWFEVPSQDGAFASIRADAICRFCGVWFAPDNDHARVFCQDCELSDCAYCGSTTNRPLLSENLACHQCETGEAA